MSGWIKLHRSIQRHWLYNNKEPFSKLEAWVDMLMEVNHSPKKVCIDNTLIECNTGESLNSQDTWAKRWNWNKSKVRRFFVLLESDGMIVLKTNRKTTHLTVCNYKKYQVERITDESQVNRKRIASESQTTPNKNVKKEKNVKKSSFIEEFEERTGTPDRKKWPIKKINGKEVDTYKYSEWSKDRDVYELYVNYGCALFMESEKVDDIIARMDYVDIPATVSNIREYYLSDEGYKQAKKGKAESINWVQRIRKGFNLSVNRERKIQREAY